MFVGYDELGKWHNERLFDGEDMLKYFVPSLLPFCILGTSQSQAQQRFTTLFMTLVDAGILTLVTRRCTFAMRHLAVQLDGGGFNFSER